MSYKRFILPVLLAVVILLARADSAKAADLPNPYYPKYVGQCTWWAAEERPDLRFNVGKASTWASVSASHGYVVDNSPEVGAIAVWGPGIAGAHPTAGHVAYVFAVQDLTHFTVSEYNWKASLGYDDRIVTWVSGIQFIHTKGVSAPSPTPDPVLAYTYNFNPSSPSSVSPVQITVGAADTAGHRQVSSITVSISGKQIGSISGDGGTVSWTTNNMSAGTYTIRLQANLANWSGSVSYRDISYQILAPSASVEQPTLANPGDSSTLSQSTDITLSWNPGAGANQYKVELWGGPYSLIVPCDWQAGLSCHIGKMNPGTMSWHVKARNSGGQESDWSDTWNFTIQGPTLTPAFTPTITLTALPQAPSAPSLSNPRNNSNLPQSTDVRFNWNQVSGASQYYLEYWGGSYSTLNSNWINDTTYHIGTMWPGTYFWHVKARNSAALESNWSDTWTFTVSQSPSQTATAVACAAPPIVDLSFNPGSPATAGTTVNIHAKATSNSCFRSMRVKVDGNVIYELGSPEFTYSWNTSGYSTGNHTVRLEVAAQGDNSWANPSIQDSSYTLQAGATPTAASCAAPPIEDLSFNPGSPATIGTTVNIHAKATWNSCFRSMRVLIDGNQAYEQASVEWTFGWNTSNFSVGNHTVRLEVAALGDNSWSSPSSQNASYNLLSSPPPQPSPTPPPPSGLGSPTLVSPSNGALLSPGTDITLQWNSVNDATQYLVEIWGGQYGGTHAQPCGWQSGTSCHIGTLSPGNVLWHVMAKDGSGNFSSWSGDWNFTPQ